MATFVALLRGINVGGHKRVVMAELREKITALGFTNVQTILQSGNVVFEGSGTASALEEKLEGLGLDVDFFVRTATEMQRVVANNPFDKEVERDPARVIVYFLKKRAPAGSLQSKGPELVRLNDRELYVVYPEGIGTSKLTGAVIEKQFGTSATARNWNTVRKLEEMTRA